MGYFCYPKKGIYMCGIAGQFNFNNKNMDIYKEVLEIMQQTMNRRGPDQKGIYMGENIGLVHSRLAVVDIENGIQPMKFVNENEEYVLVYNGELYNTEDIRKDLINKRHDFNGHSDTEVVLHAYVEYKEKCVELFNGIFAFAIWEKHNNR